MHSGSSLTYANAKLEKKFFNDFQEMAANSFLAEGKHMVMKYICNCRQPTNATVK